MQTGFSTFPPARHLISRYPPAVLASKHASLSSCGAHMRERNFSGPIYHCCWIPHLCTACEGGEAELVRLHDLLHVGKSSTLHCKFDIKQLKSH